MSTRFPLFAVARSTAVRGAGLLVPLLLSAAGSVQAQVHPWTSVGSAGVVDEADTGIVEFVLGEARVRAAAAAGSVLNLRYNVVSLEGFAGLGQYLLRARFRDNGDDARVQLNLRRYNTTGPTTELHAFDSNAYAPQVGYQTQQHCLLVNWDFVAGPHYIEATLTKSAAGGQPALGTLQLIPVGNCVN